MGSGRGLEYGRSTGLGRGIGVSEGGQASQRRVGGLRGGQGSQREIGASQGWGLGGVSEHGEGHLDIWVVQIYREHLNIWGAYKHMGSCRSLVFSGTVHWLVGRQAFIHYCGLHQV